MVANRFSFTRDHLWIKCAFQISLSDYQKHTQTGDFSLAINCVKPSDIPLTPKKFREMACKLFTIKTPVRMLLCNREKIMVVHKFHKAYRPGPTKKWFRRQLFPNSQLLIIRRFILERKPHNRDNTYTWIIWLDQRGRVSYPVDN